MCLRDKEEARVARAQQARGEGMGAKRCPWFIFFEKWTTLEGLKLRGDVRWSK